MSFCITSLMKISEISMANTSSVKRVIYFTIKLPSNAITIHVIKNTHIPIQTRHVRKSIPLVWQNWKRKREINEELSLCNTLAQFYLHTSLI